MLNYNKLKLKFVVSVGKQQTHFEDFHSNSGNIQMIVDPLIVAPIRGNKRKSKRPQYYVAVKKLSLPVFKSNLENKKEEPTFCQR